MTCYSNVVGVVIAYNPDIELLTRNLNSLTQQVRETFIYDNASKNCDEIIELVKNFSNVKLFLNDENLGLPINYNRAMTEAKLGGGANGSSLWIKTHSSQATISNAPHDISIKTT